MTKHEDGWTTLGDGFGTRASDFAVANHLIRMTIMWAMVNTHYMVDGHPIIRILIMVIINPYEPLDD